jgi:hypothetical protein
MRCCETWNTGTGVRDASYHIREMMIKGVEMWRMDTWESRHCDWIMDMSGKTTGAADRYDTSS